MRRIIITMMFLVISSSAMMAQGNLQFNQVLNVRLSGSNPATIPNSLLGSVTVPGGKVWKVESASAIKDSANVVPASIGSGFEWGLTIGDHLLYFGYGTTVSTNTPTWFGPGTYQVRINPQAFNAGGTNYVVTFSVIEYNVVP